MAKPTSATMRSVNQFLTELKSMWSGRVGALAS